MRILDPAACRPTSSSRLRFFFANLLGKRKETATDNILIVQANIEQENTHTVNPTLVGTTLVENTHKQP
jgi:hypothetical protein